MPTDYRPAKSLQNVLGFTADDLTANRAGRLTARQIADLRAAARPFWRLLTIFVVFALLAGAALLLFAGNSPDAPMLFLLTMMVPGILGVIFAVRLAGIYASIGDGSVLAAEGLAETYTKRALRGGVAFYVCVGEQEFFVGRNLQLAFQPGEAYSVFYTPRGRLIVSGEFAPAPSAETVASRLLATELASALGFSREDLDANRAGRLSPAQSARLGRIRNRAIVTALVSGAIAAGIVALWPSFNGSTTSIIFWALLLFFPAALAAVSLWNAVQHTRDLQGGTIAMAGGPLHREAENVGSTRRAPNYTLNAGGVRLHVPLAVYGAFADGGHYALYHTPHSRVLLAAEPLDAPAPAERRAQAVMA